MKRTYKKEDFKKLDFNDKCIILETLLTEDYFNGQTEINFYLPKGFKGEFGEDLPTTPPEIKKIEDDKMKKLINKLTDKLFEDKMTIEFDLEENQ